MAHIAMVTLDHCPDDDRIFHKEARALRKAGHTVTILCVMNSDGCIPGMSQAAPLNPSGESHIEEASIHIRGVLPARNKAERLLKKGFRGGFVKRFIEEGQALEADIYHAHEPASLYLAFWMARWNPGRVVFDSHESWLSGSYRDFWVKRICLPRLRYLITANPLTRGHLLARNPAMATKVVYNYPEKRVFHHSFDVQKFQQPVIAHEGILPFNRGLKLMVEAMIRLTQTIPDARLRLIGEPKGEAHTYLNHQIAKHHLHHNIEVTGWLPYEQVPAYLKDASIGLILKTPQPLNNIMGGPAIKLFNYMAAGMAIVDAGLPESTRFLDEIQAGITLRDRAPQTLANALQYLLERPDVMQQYAAQGYEASKTRTWEAEGKRLADFYKHMVLAPDSGLLIR